MKYFFIAILLAIAPIAAFAQNPDLDKLVETERAFARAAAEKGAKAAFLEFLADDGILFQPSAVNGKEYWRKQKDSPALLSWEPVWADISADGTLGYTTGPWEFRPEGKDDEPVAFGQYVTIWKKQENGEFKAVLDIGISHGKPPKNGSGLKISETAGIPDDPKATLIDHKELQSVFNPDSKLLRDGLFPITGDSILKRAGEEDWEPEDGVICGGYASLSFCYGTALVSYGEEQAERGKFLRIYKFVMGKWQIYLDLFSPLPDES